MSGTTATCNHWSRNYGSFTECASTTHTDNPGVFSAHVHRALSRGRGAACAPVEG
jgi:hypothetical protein